MRPNSFRISSDDVETFVGCSWSGEGAGQGWYEARDDGCTGVQGELQFQQAASHDRVVGTGTIRQSMDQPRVTRHVESTARHPPLLNSSRCESVQSTHLIFVNYIWTSVVNRICLILSSSETVLALCPARCRSQSTSNSSWVEPVGILGITNGL